jgi:hypothetical protein
MLGVRQGTAHHCFISTYELSILQPIFDLTANFELKCGLNDFWKILSPTFPSLFSAVPLIAIENCE